MLPYKLKMKKIKEDSNERAHKPSKLVHPGEFLKGMNDQMFWYYKETKDIIMQV